MSGSQIVFEGEFAPRAGRSAAADKLSPARFVVGYEMVHQAEIALPDSVLRKAEIGDNIQLRLSTYKPFQHPAAATTSATVGGHCLLSGDVNMVAEAIRSGSPLKLDVAVIKEPGLDPTAHKEAVAQTLNHEIGGHAAPIVQVFEYAQNMGTPQDVAAVIQQQRMPGGYLNGDAHHYAIAQSASNAANTEGSAHFIATHQNMEHAANDSLSKKRLNTAFNWHVRLERNKLGL